jgi:type III secretory pathway component EscT
MKSSRFRNNLLGRHQWRLVLLGTEADLIGMDKVTLANPMMFLMTLIDPTIPFLNALW